MLDTVLLSGKYICFSVAFSLWLAGLCLMCSELLMTSAICCPRWSSVCYVVRVAVDQTNGEQFHKASHHFDAFHQFREGS